MNTIFDEKLAKKQMDDYFGKEVDNRDCIFLELTTDVYDCYVELLLNIKKHRFELAVTAPDLYFMIYRDCSNEDLQEELDSLEDGESDYVYNSNFVDFIELDQIRQRFNYDNDDQKLIKALATMAESRNETIKINI